MSKIFRFSGYFVDDDKYMFDKKSFTSSLIERLKEESNKFQIHQLHVEEGNEFKAEEELKPNCDLALLTRHFKNNDINMNFDRHIPKKDEKYKHFKLGKIVTIVGISRHTETEEISVVYNYEGHIWNRPLEMFMSEVDKEKYPNATQQYRFELVEE